MPKADIRKIVAQNLRHLRKARGMTQEALAAAAGVNKKTPSAIERSQYAATVDVIQKLAQALNCDEVDLLRRK